ncbi:hypothetical protein NDU88_011674 [Pleurodeles waltl]|uniref:Uncharacterized protein n=1 Tax=Pleurodeles waltl TaxID=8319 RepID=A0AAV7R0P2_PLEWA|nr:hypothetical protein NDU88_011674 [Pleurodeles waltl]
MRRARARVLNGRRRPLRDAVSEGQKKGRAFPYNNRALNTQVSQCNSNNTLFLLSLENIIQNKYSAVLINARYGSIIKPQYRRTSLT